MLRKIRQRAQRSKNFFTIFNEDFNKYLKETYGVKNADELFFLDNEYKKVKYDVSDLLTGEKTLTLGELFREYNSTPAKRMAYPEVTEFFRSLTLRVPMDSISGAHKLTFAGFTGIEGHGAIFHPRTMKALGGADLDGDKATILFGLKKEHKHMYHKNKGEFYTGTGVKDINTHQLT